MKIEELNFSTRTYNCLKRRKIDTVEQLMVQSDEELMRIGYFGIGCLKEVHEKLGGMNREERMKSAENQAIFRLGQLDMKESIILALTENIEKSAEELIAMIRGM